MKTQRASRRNSVALIALLALIALPVSSAAPRQRWSVASASGPSPAPAVDTPRNALPEGAGRADVGQRQGPEAGEGGRPTSARIGQWVKEELRNCDKYAAAGKSAPYAVAPNPAFLFR